MRILMITLLIAIIALTIGLAQRPGPEDRAAVPARTPAEDKNQNDKENSEVNTETATFGAGCFWGVEAAFRRIDGVVDTAVGYMGGHVENPTYRQVCSDTTGHAEVVQVQFDPAKVSYEQLLDVFWNSHNPTQLNRQGPDYGKQYRSAIFYHSDDQKTIAEKSKAKLEQSGEHKKPIVTSIEPAQEFWRAEEYHQRYLEKKGLDQCHL